MAKNDIIEHQGTVSRIGEASIDVTILAREACSSCAARGACGMGEAKEKTVTVKVDDPNRFRPGETVDVYMARSAGLKSALLAYLAPLAVVLAVLLVLLKTGVSEVAAAGVSLAFLAVYYGLLFVFRKRIGESIYFYVDKLDE